MPGRPGVRHLYTSGFVHFDLLVSKLDMLSCLEMLIAAVLNKSFIKSGYVAAELFVFGRTQRMYVSSTHTVIKTTTVEYVHVHGKTKYSCLYACHEGIPRKQSPFLTSILNHGA